MQYEKMTVAAAMALILSGCATSTPYQALVPTRGGYSEQKLGEDRYRIVFAGNTRTSAEQVEAYLLRRAAELTLARGYDWFRVSRQRTEGDIRTIQTRYGPMRVSKGAGSKSWDNYGSFYTRPGLKLLTPIWRRISSGTGDALEASAEIVLGRGTAPQAEGVFDARRVLPAAKR